VRVAREKLATADERWGVGTTGPQIYF
jgi:hypothetical protein